MTDGQSEKNSKLKAFLVINDCLVGVKPCNVDTYVIKHFINTHALEMTDLFMFEV